MQYVGSKRRIALDLLPYINFYKSRKTYIEPFVGGANMIDKVFLYRDRIGYDNNKYLIALLNYVKNGGVLPTKNINEESYRYVKNNKDQFDDWYVGLVGFGASFGNVWFVGYGRNNLKGRKPKIIQMVNHLYNQKPKLQMIQFKVDFYNNLDFKNKICTIYCDPPYSNYNTTHYKGGRFNTVMFWIGLMYKVFIIQY